MYYGGITWNNRIQQASSRSTSRSGATSSHCCFQLPLCKFLILFHQRCKLLRVTVEGLSRFLSLSYIYLCVCAWVCVCVGGGDLLWNCMSNGRYLSSRRPRPKRQRTFWRVGLGNSTYSLVNAFSISCDMHCVKSKIMKLERGRASERGCTQVKHSTMSPNLL